jgi:DNA-binding transcriptional ArsR family regulator
MSTKAQQAKAKTAETNGKAPKTAKDTLTRKIKDATALLKQMSDPTRYTILYMLATAKEGKLNVTAICNELDQSQPAVSHHLALLRHGGLIEPERSGKHNFYMLTEKEIGGVPLGDFVKTTLGG